MSAVELAMAASVWTMLLLSLTLSWPAVASQLESGSGIVQLNFFLHESPATSQFVVPALAGHGGNFGALVIIDQPITVSPENTSQEIGRARGLAAFAADADVGAPEILWTVIIKDPREGGYGQGSLSFRGSNDFAEVQRELTIVGGSGAYRFVSGFAFHVTYARDSVTRISTSNITVFLERTAAYQTYMKLRMATGAEDLGFTAG